MSKKQMVSEGELTRLARQFRKAAGRTRAQAARDMKVSQTSVFQAEEIPEQGLLKLRIRMIEKYSPYKVTGAFYFLSRG